jgi:predicted transcriptional regulator
MDSKDLKPMSIEQLELCKESLLEPNRGSNKVQQLVGGYEDGQILEMLNSLPVWTCEISEKSNAPGRARNTKIIYACGLTFEPVANIYLIQTHLVNKDAVTDTETREIKSYVIREETWKMVYQTYEEDPVLNDLFSSFLLAPVK